MGNWESKRGEGQCARWVVRGISGASSDWESAGRIEAAETWQNQAGSMRNGGHEQTLPRHESVRAPDSPESVIDPLLEAWQKNPKTVGQGGLLVTSPMVGGGIHREGIARGRVRQDAKAAEITAFHPANSWNGVDRTQRRRKSSKKFS